LGYNPDLAPLEYNPAKARELLAQAGYPDGVDMTLVQVSGWSQKWVKMNEVIQAMVKESGFRLQIKQVDESTYYATRKTGDVDPYTQSWSADFNDPDNFFYTFFSRRGTVVRSFNNDNSEIFDALDKARSVTDPAERIGLYRDLEKKIVHEQAAWVPLFTLDHVYVISDKVKKFVVPWNGWSDMSYFPMDVE
jgi:peptide/nickel transport system substrate-binding protein/oligopeptide transport system substrate-binding protein